MITELENVNLNSKINDLDTRLKYQNYQYTCLKYELEQISSQKCYLVAKSNAIPTAPIEKQLNVTDSSDTKVVK